MGTLFSKCCKEKKQGKNAQPVQEEKNVTIATNKGGTYENSGQSTKASTSESSSTQKVHIFCFSRPVYASMIFEYQTKFLFIKCLIQTSQTMY